MRILAVVLAIWPVVAGAQEIVAESRVVAVTVYADAAEVVREVAVDLTAGQQGIVVPDLPSGAVMAGLRVEAAAGVTVGAVALRPAQGEAGVLAGEAAARARLIEAEAGLAAARAAADAVAAEVEAAEAQVAFLGRVTAEAGDGTGAEALVALAEGIGAQVLSAKRAGAEARARLVPLTRAVTEAEAAVARAEDALVALADAGGGQELTVSVAAAAAGPAVLRVVHLVEGASWRPAYEVALERGDVPKLGISRAALVTQDTGEDWRGVTLVLSTAALGQRTEPGMPWPRLRRIVSEEDLARRASEMAMADAAAPVAEVMMEPEVVAEAVASEDLVIWRYPAPVDVSDGVEDVRLALDRLDFAPEVEARAVPEQDETAFQVARFVNGSDELLLAGEAVLVRDGQVIGAGAVPRLAPGQEAEMGFGPIEGLRLDVVRPSRSEGDQGVFVKENRQEERVVYRVENLTGKAWEVRLLAGVTYAEQEDLEVEVVADPVPAETDVEGQRGVMAWQLAVAAGASAEVSVTERLVWPEGMVLE